MPRAYDPIIYSIFDFFVPLSTIPIGSLFIIEHRAVLVERYTINVIDLLFSLATCEKHIYIIFVLAAPVDHATHYELVMFAKIV